MNLLAANSDALATGAPITGLASSKLTNPYKFLVYRNATLVLATGPAASVVAFDTKLYDTGINVDVATHLGRFTAPVAGYYDFVSYVNASLGGSETYYVDLLKNGTALIRGDQIQSVAGIASLSVKAPMLLLAANDYIEVSFYNGHAGGLGVSVGSAPIQTWFAGCFVSK